MLHSYAFSNFQSFAERVEVDLTVKTNATLTDWMVNDVNGNRVSKVLAVIGHNASGKTALLKPAAFIHWFVSFSFGSAPDSTIPFSPHLAYVEQPSRFDCVFDFDGNVWRYELHATPEKVLYEALYQKKERFNYVFVREWNESTKSYQVKQQDFGLAAKTAKKVRQNVSLIAWAAQYDVPLARQLVSSRVISNVNVLGRLQFNDQLIAEAAELFAKTPMLHQQVNNLLSAWDLGLSAVLFQEIQLNPVEAPEQKTWFAWGEHVSGNKSFNLPFNLESSGTQGAFVLLSRLLPILQTGGLAVIDEFENDLHPHMLEPILELFASADTNPFNAQIVFSTHALEVLNLLEKSQIMLVEKDDNCVSTAYRLDKLEGVRSDDNYYAKYMAGAYGAIPNL
ncbi:MAG: abortive infection protein [Methylobacter sp.]|nr:MAG: abortive infection protein [Methylobacter sp.]